MGIQLKDAKDPVHRRDRDDVGVGAVMLLFPPSSAGYSMGSAMTDAASYPLRPVLPADTMALRDLFAASIEELTAEDYDDDQRAAWASTAEDAQAFAKRLADALTLVVHVEGEHLGFAALTKDNKTIDMLYVHPFYAGEDIGTALCDAWKRSPRRAARLRSRSMPAIRP